MISKNRSVAKCEASSSEEPSAVIPHAGICAGGGSSRAVPTAIELVDEESWSQELVV